MDVTRREFVVLAAAACAGCQGSGGGDNASAPRVTKVIDAGPASLYQADGVYPRFRHQGVFLVRRDGALLALSSDCTHRDCPLRAASDGGFSCKCHGSLFDQEGHVLRGPAVRALPQFPTSVSEDGHLLIQVTRIHFDEE